MDLQIIRKSIAAEIKRLWKVYDALDLKPGNHMPASAGGKISKAEKALWVKVRAKKGVRKDSNPTKARAGAKMRRRRATKA
jgi:hypothetical protein